MESFPGIVERKQQVKLDFYVQLWHHKRFETAQMHSCWESVPKNGIGIIDLAMYVLKQQKSYIPHVKKKNLEDAKRLWKCSCIKWYLWTLGNRVYHFEIMNTKSSEELWVCEAHIWW